MTTDTILAELHATRRRMLADAGGTLEGLAAGLQKRQRESGRKLLKIRRNRVAAAWRVMATVRRVSIGSDSTLKASILAALVFGQCLGCTSRESTPATQQAPQQTNLSNAATLTKESFARTVSVHAARDASDSKRVYSIVVEYGHELTPSEEAALDADQVWITFECDLIRAGVRRNTGNAIEGRGIYRRAISFGGNLTGTGAPPEEWVFDDTRGPLYAVVNYTAWSQKPKLPDDSQPTKLDRDSRLLFVGSTMAWFSDTQQGDEQSGSRRHR